MEWVQFLSVLVHTVKYCGGQLHKQNLHYQNNKAGSNKTAKRKYI